MAGVKMGKKRRKGVAELVGRTVGELSLAERQRYDGMWVATRRYEPQTTFDTLHIRAAGETAEETRQTLVKAGEDPDVYDYQQIRFPSLPSYLN